MILIIPYSHYYRVGDPPKIHRDGLHVLWRAYSESYEHIIGFRNPIPQKL